jgi:hypothetical protein
MLEKEGCQNTRHISIVELHIFEENAFILMSIHDIRTFLRSSAFCHVLLRMVQDWRHVSTSSLAICTSPKLSMPINL